MAAGLVNHFQSILLKIPKINTQAKIGLCNFEFEIIDLN